MTKKSKDERLALRISAELLELVKQAAIHEELSISAFVIQALKEKLERQRSNRSQDDLRERVDLLEELLLKKVG
jgi:uncharacterized protein (DUF1778 family)